MTFPRIPCTVSETWTATLQWQLGTLPTKVRTLCTTHPFCGPTLLYRHHPCLLTSTLQSVSFRLSFNIHSPSSTKKFYSLRSWKSVRLSYLVSYLFGITRPLRPWFFSSFKNLSLLLFYLSSILWPSRGGHSNLSSFFTIYICVHRTYPWKVTGIFFTLNFNRGLALHSFVLGYYPFTLCKKVFLSTANR